MFELKILLCNVVVPSAIALGVVLLSRWRRRAVTAIAGTETDDNEPSPSEASHKSSKQADNSDLFDRFGFMAGAATSVVGIWLAFSLRNGFELWAEDSWLQIPLATGIVGLTGLLASSVGRFAWQLPVIVAGVLASQLVFPTGENWADLADERIYWSSLLSIAPAAAWLLIPKDPKTAGLMSLGWIPCVAALAFLTAQSFMRVTEPLLAVASIFGVFGIGALCFGLRSTLQGAAGPTLFAMAAAGANAQFNSFLGLPNTLTALAISSPAMVAVIYRLCSLFGSRKSVSQKSLDLAFIVLTCIALAAVVVIWTQLAAGGGEEEW